jgi:hypothetical protein
LCYYFVEYITYIFSMHLFFYAHYSQVWCFDGVTEFLWLLSQLLSHLSRNSSVSYLISILSSSPKILSSTCFSCWSSFNCIFKID